MTVRMHCLFCHVIKGWIIFGGLSVISGFFRVGIISDGKRDDRSIPVCVFIRWSLRTTICNNRAILLWVCMQAMNISGIV